MHTFKFLERTVNMVRNQTRKANAEKSERRHLVGPLVMMTSWVVFVLNPKQLIAM